MAAREFAPELSEWIAPTARRPDAILKARIVDFVGKGEFGLGSGRKSDGAYDRVWFQEPMASDEVAYEAGVFLLRKAKAESLKKGTIPASTVEPDVERTGEAPPPRVELCPQPATIQPASKTLRLVGSVPPEIWNRLGTRILPKLRSGSDLRIGVDFSVTITADTAAAVAAELRQILLELGVGDSVKIE